MTRGRKKDLTIPPTRSLTQQRDYRARKANYVQDLEARCRRFEEENELLRRELAETKARLANPAVLLPETAAASKELMNHLAMASASLAKFHHLAFSNVNPITEHNGQGNPSTHFQTSAPCLPPTNGVQNHFPPDSQPRSGKKRLFTESEEENTYSPRVRQDTPESSRSGGSEGSCCGGYVDCEALGQDGILEERDGGIARTSGMRSTSDYPP
ncbi:hypothetical protein BDN70DRAFT_996966 [Pholiota conissans]|uniref:BZIP domain-containing protein n=1 Tax=Pholiota conissans TaxID=109636 RepID=A0A9P5YVD7_9AGAR|nr:hypothetical protein BDN70DRAFT_996966 [Pholiota conissans]